MGTIQQKFTGDASQLEREIEKLRMQQIKYEEQIKRITEESKKSADKQKEMLTGLGGGVERGISSLVKLAAGWMSVNTAISLVNKSIDDNAQRNERARLASLSVADAQAGVILNLGAGDDANKQAFLNQIGQLTKRTGFGSQVPILNAAASILSATGSDQSKTLSILGAATPLFKANPDQLPVFGGVVGDVMKATGISDPNAAVAFALSIQGQSRFESLGGMKNVTPVLAGASIGFRGDRQRNALEAAALFAAVGGELGDPEGGTTKTAVLKLIENIATATGGEGTLFEGLAKVQADPKLRKGFKEFEGQAKLLMESIVSDPNSQGFRAAQTARSFLSADPALALETSRQVQSLTESLIASSTEARAAGAIEGGQLTSGRPTIGSVRSILKNALEANVPFLNRIGEMSRFDISAGSPEQAIETAVSILSGQIGVSSRSGSFARTGIEREREQSRAAALEEQLQILMQMRDELKKINNNTGKVANIPAGAQKDAHQERD